jgi:SAM-dependent methyltransferase
VPVRQSAPVLAWDHNAYYDRLLLREVPVGAARVLDIGCGAGRLASKLAACAAHVEAVDRDPGMIDLARRRVPVNVECVLADVLEHPLTPGSYDAVVSMSALHHLPLTQALQCMATALRPGGVLAAVAVPRTDLPRDLPVEFAGIAWHLLIGAGVAAAGHCWSTGLRRSPDHDLMPVRDPELSINQVRGQAAAVLPGVRVRRLLLWRYLLIWRKPLDGQWSLAG